jgi:hypothetical protein
MRIIENGDGLLCPETSSAGTLTIAGGGQSGPSPFSRADED